MIDRRTTPLPLPTRRGLTREQSADYVGVSPTKFDEMVLDGRMPSPKEIDARRAWDRHALDIAFDALPNKGGKAPSGEAGHEIGNDWDRRKMQ
jgi:predicted DNA-binding transcriptional regulator AlpA